MAHSAPATVDGQNQRSGFADEAKGEHVRRVWLKEIAKWRADDEELRGSMLEALQSGGADLLGPCRLANEQRRSQWGGLANLVRNLLI